MRLAVQVIIRTPPTAWLLLAYVLWQGVRALRPRTQAMTRVLVLPALFIASGVLPVVLRPGAGGLLVAWALAAALLGPAGYRTGPRLLAVDHRSGTVTRPGSPVPLLRNTGVFVVHYGIAVAVATHADPGEWLTLADRVVSGATAGYFLGWALSAWRQWRAAVAP